MQIMSLLAIVVDGTDIYFAQPSRLADVFQKVHENQAQFEK